MQHAAKCRKEVWVVVAAHLQGTNQTVACVPPHLFISADSKGAISRHAQKPRKHRLDMYRFVLFLKKSSSMFLVANTFMEYGHETRCEEAR